MAVVLRLSQGDGQTITFRVTGLGQGMWFPGWAQQTAQGLGLCGWVRNLPDGSVPGGIGGGFCGRCRCGAEAGRGLALVGLGSALVDVVA